ncbi:MAG: RsmE family RNA methyltransferase [Deltaproteobacteria bacterium]
MSIPRLFASRDPDDATSARLDHEATRHLRARRLGVGDTLEAILGPGEAFHATVESVASKGARLQLGRRLAPSAADPTHARVLLLALAEPSRLEFVVEKATELGVTEIVFFRGARSQAAQLPSSRLERFARIARSACQQCGRTVPPALHQIADLNAALTELPAAMPLLAFAPTAASRGPLSPQEDMALVIGPEGGLTPEELQALSERGAEMLSLGPRILRLETAALAALARLG